MQQSQPICKIFNYDSMINWHIIHTQNGINTIESIQYNNFHKTHINNYIKIVEKIGLHAKVEQLIALIAINSFQPIF